MPIKMGDFVLIDFVAKVKETDEVFDTTIEEEAEKSGIRKADSKFEPLLVVVGERWVLKSLDDAIVGMNANDSKIIEILPQDGFGLRDPSKVRLMALRRFRNHQGPIVPGARVEVEGRVGSIRTVGAGRVQVDFNPPLAGKTLVYDLTVKKRITRKKEKTLSLVHRRMPTVDVEKMEIKFKKKIVEFKLPEEFYYVQGLQYAKRGLASDIQKFFDNLDVIYFIEEFRRPEKETKPLEEEQKQDDEKEDNQ